VTGPATCELVGWWRIVDADLWDRDYLDLVEPADLQIGREEWAEFAFGCVTAGGELEYSRTIVFLRWSGFDDGDEVSGDGSAELQDDRNRAVFRQPRRRYPNRPPRMTSSTDC
jgi:hypothetical protein